MRRPSSFILLVRVGRSVALRKDSLVVTQSAVDACYLRPQEQIGQCTFEGQDRLANLDNGLSTIPCDYGRCKTERDGSCNESES